MKTSHEQTLKAKKRNTAVGLVDLLCIFQYDRPVLSRDPLNTINSEGISFFSHQISSVFVNEPSFKTDEVISFQ